jgi:hypothetical protein
MIARGACLTEAAAEDLPLWVERYAEILGCDPRASAVAVAVEQLQERLQSLEQTAARQAAILGRTKRLVLSQAKGQSMHYKNGREAKQGDKVVAVSNGIVCRELIEAFTPNSETTLKALIAIEEVIADGFQENFYNQVDDNGAPWRPRKDNKSHPLLIKTGKMFQAAMGD